MSGDKSAGPLCVYRISDGSQTLAHKPKLESATKERCLRDAVRIFGAANVIIVADSVSDESHARICEIAAGARVVRTAYGSGAFSFMAAVRIAIDEATGDDDAVYLCEDDYLHDDRAKELIMDGLEQGDYCSLYDHPDKYEKNNVRPCQISLGKLCHWRTVESTTMTFATRARCLREDLFVYNMFCKTGYPYDHHMFLDLGRRGRTLVTPVPGASTHAELRYLTPFMSVK